VTRSPPGRRVPSEERHALHTLRERYQHDHDFFSARELARLRFLRWLYETGRVAP
jgi:hypothetical protein